VTEIARVYQESNPRVEVVAATVPLVARLALNLCDEDRAELAALCTGPPLDVLLENLDMPGRHFVGLIDGVPVCVFGVTNHPKTAGVGLPWFICSSDIKRAKKIVLRAGRAVVEELGRGYLALSNVTSAAHPTALKWVESLGFTKTDTLKGVGLNGEDLHVFAKKV
jgi:hypothetical protein